MEYISDLLLLASTEDYFYVTHHNSLRNDATCSLTLVSILVNDSLIKSLWTLISKKKITQDFFFNPLSCSCSLCTKPWLNQGLESAKLWAANPRSVAQASVAQQLSHMGVTAAVMAHILPSSWLRQMDTHSKKYLYLAGNHVCLAVPTIVRSYKIRLLTLKILCREERWCLLYSDCPSLDLRAQPKVSYHLLLPLIPTEVRDLPQILQAISDHQEMVSSFQKITRSSLA